MSKIWSAFRSKDRSGSTIQLNTTFDIQNVQSFGFGLPPNLSTQIAVDPLQSLFAVGTLKGSILVFNLFGVFHEIKELSDQPISLIAFSSSLGLLVAVDLKNVIFVYSLRQMRMKQVLLNLKNETTLSYLHISSALEQDQNFAYLGNLSGQVMIYDLEEKTLISYKTSYLGRGSFQEVVSLERHPLQPDKLLIGYLTTAIVWSVSKEKALQEIVIKEEWGKHQVSKWAPDQSGNICIATNLAKSKDPIWIGSFLTQPRDKEIVPLFRQMSSGQGEILENQRRLEEEILSKSIKYSRIEMEWMNITEQTLIVHTVPHGSIEPEKITIYYGKNFENKIQNSEEFLNIRDQRRSYIVAGQLALRLKYQKEIASHLDQRVREYLQAKYIKELTQVPLLLKFTEAGSISYYNLNELISFPDRFKMIPSPFQLKNDAQFYNSIHSLSGERLSQEQQFYLEQMFKNSSIKESERCAKADSLLSEFLDQIELSKQTKRRSKSVSVTDKEYANVTSTELVLHFQGKIEQNLKKNEYLGLLLIGDRLSKIEVYAATLSSLARIFSTKEGGRIEDAQKRGMMETIDEEVKIKEEDEATPTNGMDSLPSLDWALVGKYKVTSMIISLKCKVIAVIKNSVKQQLLQIYSLQFSKGKVKFIKIKEEQQTSFITAAQIVEVDHSFFLVTGHQDSTLQIHVLHGQIKTIKAFALSGSQNSPKITSLSPKKLLDYEGKPYLFIGFQNGLGMSYNARKWTISSVFKSPLLLLQEQNPDYDKMVPRITDIGLTYFSKLGECFVYSVHTNAIGISSPQNFLPLNLVETAESIEYFQPLIVQGVIHFLIVDNIHVISVFRATASSFQKVFISNSISLSGQFKFILGGRYLLSLGIGRVAANEVRILGEQALKDRELGERDTLRSHLEESKNEENKRVLQLYDPLRTEIMKPTRKKSNSVIGKIFGKSKDPSKKLLQNYERQQARARDLKETKGITNETKELAEQNLEKMKERSQKLSKIAEQAQKLKQYSVNFLKQARRLNQSFK